MTTNDKKVSREDLEKQVSTFPNLPGVYIMRSAENTVIYVGKARNLRNRVRQYLSGNDERYQIAHLMRKVVTIERIVTENENQALALERDLISKHKPRYNIKLKDDKAYLSIRINTQSDWPRLELVRKIADDGARYFGPYSFGYELRVLLEIIKRSIPLRTCTDNIFHNRVRPCLEYQIKRCAGPCCLPVERNLYRSWVKQAMAILEGRSESLIKDLETQMDKASEELRFEDAATLRDRIKILSNTKEGQSLFSSRAENRDIFVLHRENNLAVLAVINVKNGRLADSQNYKFEDISLPSNEVVEQALSQYYEGQRPVPDEVVLAETLPNGNLLEEFLAQKAGHKVTIIVPERGLRQRLLQLAETNAQQHFVSLFDAERRYEEIAKRMQKEFSLKQPPRRIECFDISNLQGSDIVGAHVHFYDGEPDKSQYRKYIIKQQGKPDDFASIHEVVSRRLIRAKKEGIFPDLLIIDGGAQQLAKALQARQETGVDIEIISIAKIRIESKNNISEVDAPAKKPERIFINPDSPSIALNEHDDLTFFMQRVRDEVHNFVLTFHRYRRSARVIKTKLDEIAGVNPNMRARLIAHFGSTEAIAKQLPEDVAKIGRMPVSLANKIINTIKVA